MIDRLPRPLLLILVGFLLVGRVSSSFLGSDDLRNKLLHLQRAEYWQAVGTILFPAAHAVAAPPPIKTTSTSPPVAHQDVGLVRQKISQVFPGAVSNLELVRRLAGALRPRGFGRESTLLATSLCCDELNRALEMDLSREFGGSNGEMHFRLGGLAGFPFAGTTGFGAMSSHVPDSGSCLLVYGPHCGVDERGTTGTVPRRGKKEGGACCGSASAAAQHVLHSSQLPRMLDPLDFQQGSVVSHLIPYADRVRSAMDPMEEVPYCLYEAQDAIMHRILDRCRGKTTEGMPLALLGGIEINTPPSAPDYFLPLRFDLYEKGLEEEPKNLMANFSRRSLLTP